jgi:mRNA-degrading endonuclease RelE of RelBE toxin-antitoxin system
MIIAIEELSKIPPGGDIKLLKGQSNIFRARVGKYRIIFRITDDIVFIRDIDSRGQVYNGGY